MLATQAKLETLAAYISPRECHDAASQLPKVIKEYMPHSYLEAGQPPAPSPVRSEIVEDFYQRISRLEEKPLETAREHARGVMSVLRDALSESEFENICVELPPELYNEFFAGN